MKLLFVGMGGFIGAILRYSVSGWVQTLFHDTAFPLGTLTVNIIGCFVLGLLSQLVESQMTISSEMRLLVMVGLLGAFTTYSTFSNETWNLLRDQQVLLALLNMGIHLVLGLAAVYFGRLAVITLWR